MEITNNFLGRDKEVVPGIGESWHVLNDYGSAGVRIRATEEQYNQIEGTIKEKVTDPELKKLVSKVRIIYDTHGYTELSIQGYPRDEDRLVVELLNSLSKIVYTSIYNNTSDAPVVCEADGRIDLFDTLRSKETDEMYSDKSVIPVMQGHYAELTSETNFERMETWGIGSCVGLVLIDNDKKILAHVDYPKRLTSLEYEGHFKKAVVVLSLQSFKETVEAVIKFAREHADTVEVQTQQSYSAKIGVDALGRVYVPDKLIKGVLPEEIPAEVLNLWFMNDAISGASLHKMPLPTSPANKIRH
ncbi:MAG: hypothetical protein ACP5NE_02080 [Candidatus Micrarchaeia archaeon]